MTHDEARELFTARIDDALEADARHRLDAHLGGCADCRCELDRLERTVALVRRARLIHAPAGFAERVAAAAPPARRHRLARALFRPLRVKLPLQAAAILLVAVAATMLYRGEPALQDATGRPAPTREQATASEGRARAKVAERPASPADRAEPPAAATADAPGDIVGASWTVTDRATAVHEVESLVARLGGTALSRHDEADTTILEVWLPQGAWETVARELDRHGRRVDPGLTPGGPVRALLRITG